MGLREVNGVDAVDGEYALAIEKFLVGGPNGGWGLRGKLSPGPWETLMVSAKVATVASNGVGGPGWTARVSALVATVASNGVGGPRQAPMMSAMVAHFGLGHGSALFGLGLGPSLDTVSSRAYPSTVGTLGTAIGTADAAAFGTADAAAVFGTSAFGTADAAAVFGGNTNLPLGAAGNRVARAVHPIGVGVCGTDPVGNAPSRSRRRNVKTTTTSTLISSALVCMLEYGA